MRRDRDQLWAEALRREPGAPLVLVLNNDAYPIDDALAPLVAAFDRPGVVIASGALRYEDDVTQDAGMVVLPNAHWHHSYRNLPSWLPAVRGTRAHF